MRVCVREQERERHTQADRQRKRVCVSEYERDFHFDVIRSAVTEREREKGRITGRECVCVCVRACVVRMQCVCQITRAALGLPLCSVCVRMQEQYSDTECCVKIQGQQYIEGVNILMSCMARCVSFAKEPYKRDNILQKRPVI